MSAVSSGELIEQIAETIVAYCGASIYAARDAAEEIVTVLEARSPASMPPAVPPAVEAIMSLTNRPLDVECATDGPARETSAEDAIEITDEMIEAGVEVLSGFNRDFDLREDVVSLIFRKMYLRFPNRLSSG